LVTAYLEHLWQDFPNSIYPGGLGEPNLQATLNSFFDTEGFGTHNTYISIMAYLGAFGIIVFARLYKGIKVLIKDKFFYFFLPALTISITEDCFGPGQLLYMYILAILVISTSYARPRRTSLR
ncbi:MAG TPA: hypothetical protein PKL06_09225, partial [Chitinophagales bacterium]|nr:hypothetical protein [Chitinophagales bacterium]